MNKFLLTVILCLACYQVFSQSKATPYIVMVSFDGFRYDYVEKHQLPNFMALINEGASAEAMIPSFPSKTFPNHYTLVTGLYPGHHGLVDNTFYDSITGQNYTGKKKDLAQDPFYYGGLPLWQLVQQHGMKSASYFWVGSEAEVAGSFPDHYEPYNESVPDKDRIQAVMNWLKLPEPDRPHFISLYFSFIDHVSHLYGPNAPETVRALTHADKLIGEIRQQISELDIAVNLIVVSDHGMFPMKRDPAKEIKLSSMLTLSENGMHVVNNETHVHLYCDGELKKKLYKEAVSHQQHYRAFLRENTPEDWHYNANYRIGDILLVADSGYTFRNNERENAVYGVHGFDPYTTPELQAIFYAWGPDIRPGVRIPAFRNIHVYPFIALLLGIEVSDIDGSADVLKHIIRE